jgi:uncharacterized protein (TIGR03435 family)
MRMAFAALLLVTCADAQTFEIASVKPTPVELRNKLKRECVNDRFAASAMPLEWHIVWAWGLRDQQVTGLPDWTQEFNTYTFDAKAVAPMDESQCKAMVRALIEDRFKMRSHIEQRELAVYELVVAKGGSKMREVTEDTKGSTGVGVNGSHEVDADRRLPPGWPMSRLAGRLEEAGRIVIDRTGLPGLYSFELAFSRKPDDGKPSIFTAVQEQLGLKLQPSKAKLDVLVIDHIEKAQGN